MKNSAFTLIEILIVVILLGILAAIVMPMLSTAADDANTNAQDTDAASLQFLVELYRVKEGAYPAALGDLDPDYTRAVPGNPVTIAPYTYNAVTGRVSP